MQQGFLSLQPVQSLRESVHIYMYIYIFIIFFDVYMYTICIHTQTGLSSQGGRQERPKGMCMGGCVAYHCLPNFSIVAALAASSFPHLLPPTLSLDLSCLLPLPILPRPNSTMSLEKLIEEKLVVGARVNANQYICMD